MTRVVAGSARGRRLEVPPGRATRPTSDRAREALFSAVESRLRTLHGAAVLDLYAGSGAVGLEALSRGAARATLVEQDRAALATLRANVAALGLPGADVVAGDVARVVARGPGPAGPYDLAFLDPPYDRPTEALRAVLDDLLAMAWLRPGALVVVERATRDPRWRWPSGYDADRERAYGEGTLWYGRAAGQSGAGAAVGDARSGGG
jgi:16S rRNA (guanine966-N2)-methyltransferase